MCELFCLACRCCCRCAALWELALVMRQDLLASKLAYDLLLAELGAMLTLWRLSAN
jgi:hypothetical protein